LLQTNTPALGDLLYITVNKKAVCAGPHVGSCCDTNGEGAGVCEDAVLAADCMGPDKVWTANGKCADIECVCIPMCEGKHCGPDGCGGICPDVPPCNDGIACNGVETCNEQTGACVPGTAIVCDDGFACTGLEECTEPNGDCTNPPDVVCDDGLGCNGVEVCLEPAGDCSNPPDVVCPDDGNVCNGPEYCLNPAGNCVSGPALNCPDDGIFCNGVESCDPLQGCVHSGFPCEPGEECNETDHCFVPPIPTVSEWGLVILTLLLLTGAKVYFSRRQAIA
jgi:hypothetical protein